MFGIAGYYDDEEFNHFLAGLQFAPLTTGEFLNREGDVSGIGLAFLSNQNGRPYAEPVLTLSLN